MDIHLLGYLRTHLQRSGLSSWSSWRSRTAPGNVQQPLHFPTVHGSDGSSTESSGSTQECWVQDHVEQFASGVETSRKEVEGAGIVYLPHPPAGPRQGGFQAFVAARLQMSSRSSWKLRTAPGNVQQPLHLPPLHSFDGSSTESSGSTQECWDKCRALNRGISVGAVAGASSRHHPTMENPRVLVPHPPLQKREGKAPRSGMYRRRQSRPITVQNDSRSPLRTNAGGFPQSLIHSNARVTMVFLGKGIRLSRSTADNRDEIAVYQQHCGGENICVYKGNLLKGESFQFISRRHRSFPFSLTFFLNGLRVDRLSACCEYKHRKQCRVGGTSGSFGILKVEGASPCYRCIISNYEDKKPSPPTVRTHLHKKHVDSGGDEEIIKKESVEEIIEEDAIDKEVPIKEQIIDKEEQKSLSDGEHEHSDEDTGRYEYDDDFESDEESEVELTRPRSPSSSESGTSSVLPSVAWDNDGGSRDVDRHLARSTFQISDKCRGLNRGISVGEVAAASSRHHPTMENPRLPVPHPPLQKRDGKAPRSGRYRWRQSRPITVQNDSQSPLRTNAGGFPQSLNRSNARVTMVFLGKGIRLSRSTADNRDEIAVYQQHCGGENICVYKGNLLEGENFQFISRRHRGFPFSLTFFLNGLRVDRLSACCEYKHRKRCRVGGTSGSFGILKVEGASPCYRCIISNNLDKKPFPPTVRTEHHKVDSGGDEERRFLAPEEKMETGQEQREDDDEDDNDEDNNGGDEVDYGEDEDEIDNREEIVEKKVKEIIGEKVIEKIIEEILVEEIKEIFEEDVIEEEVVKEITKEEIIEEVILVEETKEIFEEDFIAEEVVKEIFEEKILVEETKEIFEEDVIKEEVAEEIIEEEIIEEIIIEEEIPEEIVEEDVIKEEVAEEIIEEEIIEEEIPEEIDEEDVIKEEAIIDEEVTIKEQIIDEEEEQKSLSDGEHEDSDEGTGRYEYEDDFESDEESEVELTRPRSQSSSECSSLSGLPSVTSEIDEDCSTEYPDSGSEDETSEDNSF